MFYDRKIRYLDYCRNGERVKSGGFAKTEVQDDSFKMEITLKGIPGADRENVDILLSGAGKEVAFGKVAIKSGFGEFRHSCPVINGIDGSGIEYAELSGIKIRLSETEEISCKWDVDKGSTKRRKEIAAAEEIGAEQRAAVGFLEGIRKKGKAFETEAPRQAPNNVTEQKEETVPRRESMGQPIEGGQETMEALKEHRQDSMEAAEYQKKFDDTAERQEQKDREAEYQLENDREMSQRQQGGGREADEQKGERNRETEQYHRGEPRGKRQPEAVTLLEDKWLQLAAIYPHIKPFRDEREYLSIGPADFVLFSTESYREVNNSFLLHGYYNYRHLILTRVEKRGEILYYVGVPGNYYDREKQVAVMFGFESFECAEEPAQNGDFGYYMMKVQI